jgi:subtilisin family serine protease
MSEQQFPGIGPDTPLEDFILSNYTASVIIRRNDFSNPLLENNSYIRRGKTLNGNYMIVYATINVLEDVLHDSKIFNKSLVLGLLSQIDLESAGVASVHQQPYLSLRGEGALVGFVDTGIDFTKTAFIWENGESKIKYIWDQTVQGNPPADYGYGTEFTSEQINTALNSPEPQTIVPHFDNDGHGTFLASVAASRESGMYLGVAPDAEILVVKLKSASLYYRERFLSPPYENTNYESADLMLGIDYLITKAKELGRPLAICIGIGTAQSGHDGFNIMEDYITGISYQRGLAICCAAGNEGAGS